MLKNLPKTLASFGVKTRLLFGFGAMVILTFSVGAVGWWGIGNIQRALQVLQNESLPEVARSMALAEHSASLVAQAPFVANAKILFHLDEESARLTEKLRAFSLLARELRASGLETGANPGEAAPELNFNDLAMRIEATLLELVDITRQGIFLSATLRDRQYALTSVYEGIESKIVAHLEQRGTNPRAELRDTSATPRQPAELKAATPSLTDRQRFLLAGILGETHRTAGALIAAPRAEDYQALHTLKTTFEWGALLLRNKLAKLPQGALGDGIGSPVATLLDLGPGETGIFALRREQLRGEDRRAYLLTVSNLLSAELNNQVAEFVTRVETGAEQRSAEAVSVLKTSEKRILLLGTLCLAAAVMAMFYVARDLGGNLAAVTQSMVQLAGGNREIQVPAVHRPDEIGALARAFNVFKENSFKLDATSRKLAENNALLEAILHHMNDGMAVFDARDRLLAWNPQFLSLYGIDAREIRVGLPLDTLNHILMGNEATVRSLDGKLIPSEQYSRERRLESQQVEEQLPDGRLLELRSDPMPGGGFVTMYTDLTERKTIEAQLRQAQKMESVGQLTGGMAHDFNNLLAAIIGNLSLLQEELAGQDELRRKVLRALEAAERGAMITQRLLAFSRKQALQPQRVDINDLVEGMMDLVAFSVGETIKTELRLGNDVWPVVIDPGQLENALMNLMLNSRDAMPNGGQLTFRTENRTLDGAQQPIEAGDYVVLSVQDTGTGMSGEILNRVFEPFFTTKDVGAGSGLGLSMVYGFIRQSGGHVQVDSAPGHGTTIRLYLPRAPADGPRSPDTAAAKGPVATEIDDPCGKTVLVIEDDAIVRGMAVDMLTSLGYRTVQAGDGPEALRVLEDAEDIDLLFTDVVLPGDLNGPAIVRLARQRYPGMKCLYCSAYPRDALVDDGFLEGNVELIEKPYKKAALAEKLTAVLAR